MNKWKSQAKRRSYLLIEAVISCALITASLSFLGHSIFAQKKMKKQMWDLEKEVQLDTCIAYVKRALSKNPHLITQLNREKSIEIKMPYQGHFITQGKKESKSIRLFEEKIKESGGANCALVRMKVGKTAKKKSPLIRLALSKAPSASRTIQK